MKPSMTSSTESRETIIHMAWKSKLLSISKDLSCSDNKYKD